MWPCDVARFEGSMHYTGQHATAGTAAEINTTLDDVLRTLQSKRAEVVAKPQNVRVLEQYLTMLYVLFNGYIEPSYDAFRYTINGDDNSQQGVPVMRWYHAGNDCVYQSTCVRFEIVMTGVAYVQLLMAQCDMSATGDVAVLRRNVTTMKACCCVCRELIMLNRRRVDTWIVHVFDTDGYPADWVAREPLETDPTVIGMLYNLCAARCQRLCLMLHYAEKDGAAATVADGPDGDGSGGDGAFIDTVAANVKMHELYVDVLGVTHREEDAAAAENALVCACLEYAQYVINPPPPTQAHFRGTPPSLPTQDDYDAAMALVLYARAIVDDALSRAERAQPSAAVAGGGGGGDRAYQSLQCQRQLCDGLYHDLFSSSATMVNMIGVYQNPQKMADAEASRLREHLSYEHVVDVLRKHSAAVRAATSARARRSPALFDDVEPRRLADLIDGIATNVVRSWQSTLQRLLTRP